MIKIKFNWQFGASHVDLISRSVFFLFFNLPVEIKTKSSNTKRYIYIYYEIFILRASAAKNQKSAEKVGSSGADPWGGPRGLVPLSKI